MTVVFKLGGSLLTLPGFADRLDEALKQRTGKNCLFVLGGGATTDVVREWSRIHILDEEAAHWLAISSIDLNGQLLQRLLNWKSTSSRAEADEFWANEKAPLLLEMTDFLKDEEAKTAGRAIRSSGSEPLYRHRENLPHHWNVTSDSLAAWTAIQWPAEELVLLKSVPVPAALTAKQASDRQLVDSHFPTLVDQIPLISWCNLRAPIVVIEPWLAVA